MAQSFLGNVVQQLKAQRPNWSYMCFVVPNRRARLFLQKELNNTLTGPLILPEMLSIDDFVNSISTFIPATELQQQRALYQSYRATTQSKTPDAFEAFLGWSSTLLKDLNTMEQYLLEKEPFFKYLASLHKIRLWGEQQDKTVKNYTAFWEQLPVMYRDFSQRLASDGLATPGMCYRTATSLLETYIQHKKDVQFIFCGFNALSPSEEHIVQELLTQERAQIFWDIDKQMLENKLHQAGIFIRDYVTRWPQYKENVLKQTHEVFWEPKKVNIIEVQQQVGQAKQLGALLSELQEPEDWAKTAVVLADESLLLPLLYALPPSVKNLNISMGFPLEQHPLAVFVSAFLNMAFRQNAKGFYYADVETLLTLPETYALFSDQDAAFCNVALNNAKKENRSYIGASFILQNATASTKEMAGVLFRENRTPEQWIDDVIAVLPRFFDPQQSQPLTHVYSVAVETFLGLFNQIKEVLTELNQTISFTLLRGLYWQLSAGQKLDFVGAPLEGLQILGVLETRTIDFDRVLMAGVNEGILPSQGGQPSWIPYDVKKEFGLPTQEEQDAIFTYHFYRLMYRAKEVYLMYNGTTDGMQVGERSRFIRQWAFECPAAHEWHEAIQEANFIPPSNQIKSIPKTEAVQQKLMELAEYGFSPSALNLFVKDAYAFYKRYLLGIKEEDELEEYFSHRTYGTLIHNCLEALYTPFVGKTLTVAACKQIIANISDVANAQVSKTHSMPLTGKNVLALAAIKRNIQNIISAELVEIENGNIIQLLALEQKLETTREISGIQTSVKIRGTIDRVDRYNGKIRVLDYKTGTVTKSKLSISDWSLVAVDPDYGQARQLLLYALLWNANHPEQLTDYAGIIALKEQKGGVLYVSEKTADRSKDAKALTQDELEKAENMLVQLIQEMFDSKTPFSEPTS